MGPKTLPTIWGTYMKLVTKYQISAINNCWEKCDKKCAYMFNVYKNQLSRQTGSRNLTGPNTLPTIWYTYMTLVTKYQISAINNYWEKCDEKYFGRTEVKRKMYIYKCMLNVYKNQQNRGAGVYKCFIFILFLENVNYNEDNHLLTSTYSYQGTLVTLTIIIWRGTR